MSLEVPNGIDANPHKLEPRPPRTTILALLVILQLVLTVVAIGTTFLLGMSVARCNGVTVFCDFALLNLGQSAMYPFTILVAAVVIVVTSLLAKADRRAYWVPIAGSGATAAALAGFALLVYIATRQDAAYSLGILY